MDLQSTAIDHSATCAFYAFKLDKWSLTFFRLQTRHLAKHLIFTKKCANLLHGLPNNCSTQNIKKGLMIQDALKKGLRPKRVKRAPEIAHKDRTVDDYQREQINNVDAMYDLLLTAFDR